MAPLLITSGGQWKRADGTVAAGADSFVLRTTQPIKGVNIGHTTTTSSTPRTTWAGAAEVTVTTPGTTYVNVDFGSTFLNIRCANVYFLGCTWDNTVIPGSPRWQIDAGAGCVNLRVEHCTAKNQASSSKIGAFIGGHDFKTYRNDVRGYVDAYCTYNANVASAERADVDLAVELRGDYMGEFCYLYDPTIGVVHPSDTETHNEGWQPQGGKNVQVIGCTIDGNYSTTVGYFGPMRPATRFSGQPNAERGGSMSCITLTESVARTSEHIVEDNWILGGNFGINYGSNPQINGTNMGRIWRNKFDRTQYTSTGQIMIDANLVVDTGDGTANANRYIDNNAEVAVRRNA